MQRSKRPRELRTAIPLKSRSALRAEGALFVKYCIRPLPQAGTYTRASDLAAHGLLIIAL